MITTHTAESLRAFESRIRDHFAAGELPCLIHLSGGNEEKLIEIFADILPFDYVFSTHRNHYHALLKGIPEAELEADILAGRSMFIFSAAHNFFTSAILASTCCIAAGVAYDLKHRASVSQPPPRPSAVKAFDCFMSNFPRDPAPSVRAPHVYCFLGDGAEEQGHFYEAALFSEAHDLPITFIIEDNARQVDTDKETRRGKIDTDTFANQAHAPLDHFNCVHRYHYTPTYPHGGGGLPAGSVTFKPEAIARLKSNQ